MKISLHEAGKKYYREWIFRKANVSFSTGNHAVILGPNGSGKSTMLQVIAGAIMPTEGSITFEGEKINAENLYQHLSLAAPYLELIEEFTLREIIDFHFKFKSVINNETKESVLASSGLASSSEKVFRYFSSGMKQRVKLLLALMSDTEFVMLDEPCSNLDAAGIEWYADMIKKYSDNRLLIVASNHNPAEYFFCDVKLNMSDWKNGSGS